MKRLLQGTLFVLLCAVVLGSTASASAVLELYDNNNGSYVTITDTGAVTCVGADCGTAVIVDTFAPGAITLGLGTHFDDFSITSSSGSSNSPNCNGVPYGPGCSNTNNVNSVSTGAASLSIYFASTGFMPGAGTTGLIVGFSTPGETGTTAIQTAYATSGAVNPLLTSPATPVLGASVCGAPSLTINGPTAINAEATNCAAPGQPFSLELATTMTATAAGQAFNLNGNISAVPEPAAVTLFGTVLVLCSLVMRRKRKLS